MWKVERPITVSIIHVSKQDLSKQHNGITIIVLENLQGNYPSKEQLVSPRVRSFGAENYGCKPGMRAIKGVEKKKKKKRETPLRALTRTWPQNHHV